MTSVKCQTTNDKCLWSLTTWTTAATSPPTHLVTNRLKLLPLLRRQYFLQTRVSLPANLVHLRFRLATHRTQLVARVAKDKLDLRLLVCAEIQPFGQLLHSIARPRTACQPAINVECKDARRKTKHEDDQCRYANLPSVLSIVVHRLPCLVLFGVNSAKHLLVS